MTVTATHYELDPDERFVTKSIGIADVPNYPDCLVLGIVAERMDGSQVAHEHLVNVKLARALLLALGHAIEQIADNPS